MKSLVSSVLLAGILLGCQQSPHVYAAEEAITYQYFDQGWEKDTREKFWFTPQGSHMMPYRWFRALEAAEGGQLFSDPEYLQRFGLLPPDGSYDLNPDGFSIGIAVEIDQARAYLPASASGADDGQVGLTCAACHTGVVRVEGKPILVDGAPSRFDFDRFYAALSNAFTLTLLVPERFARFAAQVLSNPEDEQARAHLLTRLREFQVKLAGDAALRAPVLASGPGRVDALTQIVNSLAVRDQQEPSNLFPVKAPTSYPALWLAPQLEFVQWNPIAASPIGRNGGQVMGVFGQTNLAPGNGTPFQSTMLLEDLHNLEQWLTVLRPPRWDEALMGEIDVALAEQGSEIFATNCSGCHNMAPYKMTDPANNFFGATFIKIGRVDFRKLGTDPAYVQRMATRQIETNALTAPLFDGRKVVPALEFFSVIVGTTVKKAMQDEGLSQKEQAEYSGFRLRKDENGRPVPYTPPSLTDLKASPLAAVWATGPYLHNGSVPTVYELLSPPEERRTVFWTGSEELDREKLGFISTDAPDRFRFDTKLAGNGNQGHRFPASGLTHDQRIAVIEYLKTQ